MSHSATLLNSTQLCFLHQLNETNYVQGACGFPSRTPDFSTCTGGLFGDRYMGYRFVAVSYFLIAMNLLVLAPIMFKRDLFGLVVVCGRQLNSIMEWLSVVNFMQENLLMIADTAPVITLIFLDDCFKSQLGQWWPSTKYSVTFLIGNVTSFISSSITLGYPIALYYLYWHKVNCYTYPFLSLLIRARCYIQSLGSTGSFHEDAKGIAKSRSSEGTHSNGKQSSIEVPSSPSTMPHMNTLAFDTKNPHELALQQCIMSIALQQVYLKFSIDEFTVGAAAM
jgi:hypothetical protein